MLQAFLEQGRSTTGALCVECKFVGIAYARKNIRQVIIEADKINLTSLDPAHNILHAIDMVILETQMNTMIDMRDRTLLHNMVD